ncbi:MAG: ParB N-terminal domain-containing protein [Planctomycetota bacterium]|jgi:hypothetical protein
MEECYLPSPIVVNEDMEIIDGQHRFVAAKSLKKPIYYVVLAGAGLPEVQRLNANQKAWTLGEYASSYAKTGIIDYVKYKRFKHTYGFGHNECLLMLTGKRDAEILRQFKQGALTIKNYDSAVSKADKIVAVKPYYDGYRRRNLVFALLKLFKNPDYNHTEFLKKLSYQSTRMVKCVDRDDYMRLIEKIYNYRRRDKVRLF